MRYPKHTVWGMSIRTDDATLNFAKSAPPTRLGAAESSPTLLLPLLPPARRMTHNLRNGAIAAPFKTRPRSRTHRASLDGRQPAWAGFCSRCILPSTQRRSSRQAHPYSSTQSKLAKHFAALLATWPFHQSPTQKWLGHQINRLNRASRHFSTRPCNGFIKFPSSISVVRRSLVSPFPRSHLHLAPALPSTLRHIGWLGVSFDYGTLSPGRSRTIGKVFLRQTRWP